MSARRGMTLVDTVIGVAIIAIVAFSIYQGYSVLLRILSVSRIKIAATFLANEQMELVRNIPYASVGVVGGIPPGVLSPLQSYTKDNLVFSVVTTVRSIDDSFDGTATTTPQDLSPADYKLVELAIACVSCLESPTFTFNGRIAPKSLEGASTNGSLFIQAIDANGQPVSGAHVEIINNKVMPPIAIMDPGNTTGNDGFLRFVDAPPSAPTYEIKVTKAGYSTDRTYATTTENPNPIRPHAMVVAQTVTQASFAIDRTSTVNAASVDATCVGMPNTTFLLTGSKLIGANPDVLKFSEMYITDSSGLKVVGGLEWDRYSVAVSSAAYDLAGTIPNPPLNLLPNAAQNFKMVMQPKSPNALLVTVQDAASGLPVTGASVTLSKTGYSATRMTGRGFLRQSDWSGGAGQGSFLDPARYAEDDGNVEITDPAGEVRLKAVASSTFSSSGFLISSTFDTGSPSSFYDVTFQPTSQPPDTGPLSVRFQLAATNTPNPVAWDFAGPDGTAGTYFTASDTNVNPAQNGNRYFRYKAYLSTASTTFTPSVSDIAVTFASACVPPGQTFFNGLASDTYTLAVVKNGYQSATDTVTTGLPWQEYPFSLVP